MLVNGSCVEMNLAAGIPCNDGIRARNEMRVMAMVRRRNHRMCCGGAVSYSSSHGRHVR